MVQRLGSTVLIFLLGLLPLFSSAQTRTVGVLQYDPATSPGYTLLAPQRSDSIWLIDECGRVLHSWHDGLEPGNSTYLLENGHLLRTSSEGQSANPSFVAGGAADHIRLYDWDNTLLWNFTWSTPTTRLHHDIAYLPNGNIVLLAWEYKSVGEALTSGRDPSEISAFGLWPETLVEIRPIFPDSGEIVWEWHAWDHLVQDYDSNLANFGNPSDHPELLDLNYLGDAGVGTVDWLHCNSVAYHPDLDQIMLSSREFSEIWILDHSTTTAEAAGHTGGNQGRGGDLIY
ncbi:MAG: aryl-sulfate sulfotransferase, partial [Bacteroidota bacterium]